MTSYNLVVALYIPSNVLLTDTKKILRMVTAKRYRISNLLKFSFPCNRVILSDEQEYHSIYVEYNINSLHSLQSEAIILWL